MQAPMVTTKPTSAMIPMRRGVTTLQKVAVWNPGASFQIAGHDDAEGVVAVAPPVAGDPGTGSLAMLFIVDDRRR